MPQYLFCIYWSRRVGDFIRDYFRHQDTRETESPCIYLIFLVFTGSLSCPQDVLAQSKSSTCPPESIVFTRCSSCIREALESSKRSSCLPQFSLCPEDVPCAYGLSKHKAKVHRVHEMREILILFICIHLIFIAVDLDDQIINSIEIRCV